LWPPRARRRSAAAAPRAARRGGPLIRQAQLITSSHRRVLCRCAAAALRDTAIATMVMPIDQLLISARVFMLLWVAGISCLWESAGALPNGLGRLPGLGWNSDYCTNCTDPPLLSGGRLLHANSGLKRQPFGYGGEHFIKRIADHMHTVKHGGKTLQELGFHYINMDASWDSYNRSDTGELVPDPKLWPSGLDHTISYVHSLGLGFGLCVRVSASPLRPHAYFDRRRCLLVQVRGSRHAGLRGSPGGGGPRSARRRVAWQDEGTHRRSIGPSFGSDIFIFFGSDMFYKHIEHISCLLSLFCFVLVVCHL
jgi:hypothetical protein